MSESTWQQVVNSFRQEAASITGKAEALSERFSTGCRQAEVLKVAFLMYCLERQRRHLARVRGFAGIRRSGRGLRRSLVIGVLGLIGGGMISRDKFFAVREGLASFDAALQAQGQTSWAVVLGKDLRVLPRGDFAATHGETVVTWESLRDALAGLGTEALQGAKLGNLDSVLARLQWGKALVPLGIVAKTIAVKARKVQGPKDDGLHGMAPDTKR